MAIKRWLVVVFVSVEILLLLKWVLVLLVKGISCYFLEFQYCKLQLQSCQFCTNQMKLFTECYSSTVQSLSFTYILILKWSLCTVLFMCKKYLEVGFHT